MRLLSLQLSPSLQEAGRKSNDGTSSSHPQACGCLDISKHCTSRLTCPPCPTLGRIFRGFLARSAALSLWKPSSPEVLVASEHPPSPAGVSHPGQAHTVLFTEPRNSRAPPTLACTWHNLPNPHRGALFSPHRDGCEPSFIPGAGRETTHAREELPWLK